MLFTLLIGGSILAGLALSGKKAADKTKSLTSQALDDRYQKFLQEKVDPLFGSRKRSQQMEVFSGDYNVQEADINRRLGLSAASTGLAVAGAVFYPPLSLLSAAGLVYIFLPLARRSLHMLIEEKRLKYRLIAICSVWAGLLGGYYVISNLMSMVVFFAFKLAARTQAHSQASLTAAFSLQQPGSVWVQLNGVETEIGFDELRIGDIIILTAGQTVPVDGYVAEGMATVDQHILTGESQPVEKSAADPVFANTLLLTGKLYVRVSQTGSETAAAQIVKILSNVASHRSEHEAHAEQLADKLAAPVLAASGAALLTVGGTGAVVILNSGFCSTMLISGPLSMLTHLNLASHHGILVKDGRSLEKLRSVDTLVFDKTGTLTSEQPEVSRIYCCPDWQEEQVLTYAALAEKRQTHPIAKAVSAAAAQRGLHIETPDTAAYEVGFGVEVHHRGQHIRVGSSRFMQQSRIRISADIETARDHCRQNGSSLVMVAVDGHLIGALELSVQLRPETRTLIDSLHQRGLKLCILSGDHENPTRHLAQSLNIDSYFAEVLPEGKADKIRQLQQSGHTVCFVGDGINDAIALQQADVSVSMRGATSLATDCAQIILMNQSLQKLDQLFDIAEDFNKNLDRTMRLSYIPGSILIAGVFLLNFGMPTALLLYSSGLAASMYNALSPLKKLSCAETNQNLKDKDESQHHPVQRH